MASAEAAPIRDAEAAELFAPLRGAPHVALAVSGGSDSLALLHLWARAGAIDATLPPATVFTVDHRLRAESAAEADFVAAAAARHGLAHRTLVRDGAAPAGNLQDEARRARYALLVAAAHGLGATALLTAHHAEDQAETFLARLARGSGVVGLAAMAKERRIDGLVLFRPFLDLPKARLVATLVEAGERWIDDPSNRDPRFGRVRLREAAPLLARLGLDRDRLVATARAMARAAAAIETMVDRARATAVTIHPAGWAVVAPEAVADLAEEVRLRLFGRLIRDIGGETYGPRLERLEDLVAAIVDAAPGAVVVRTLGGVRIERRRGRIFLAVEAGRGGEPELVLAPGENGRWRGRRVDLAADAPGVATIGRLGAEGRRAITARACPGPALLGTPAPSAAVIESAPAIRVEGRLVACPGLGYEAEDRPGWGRQVRFAATG